MGDRFKNEVKKAQQNKARQIASSKFIPQSVAISPKLGEHGRSDSYKLIFAHYNHNQCELKKVKNFKPLIDKFNSITQSNYSSLFVRDKIYPTGNYKNLFNNLPQDVDELEEIKFADTGRIFFFKVETYLCIVTILVMHR